MRAVLAMPLFLAASTAIAAAQDSAPQGPKAPPFVHDHVQDLAWRNLGPANPMGRITDIEVAVPKLGHIWYVGTAGGGVWKTTNSGTTWEVVFDQETTVSIGDIAVAPADPEIVWVGTGEENARNSVQWGDGVYKSTDGGSTWQHMGLRETFQIGHIAIHPENPDIVFVAALGRLWGDNPERGVYRTKDGGNSWDKVLYLDDKTGCIDVRIDPRRPDLVYACMYERRRDAFDGNDPAVRLGERSGFFRSINGGDDWQEVTEGLPTVKWGRSGLAVYEKNPDTLFLIVETERSGWASGSQRVSAAADNRNSGEVGPRGTAVMGIGGDGEDGSEEAPGAILTWTTRDGAADRAGLTNGDRIVKIDDEDVKTYADLLEIVKDSGENQKVKLAYVRGGETTEVEVTFDRRGGSASGLPGGANTVPGGNRLPNAGRLGGQTANRQARQERLGEDAFETGGIFRSDDRGETWSRINSLTDRPFYYSVIAVDPQNDQNLYSVGVSFYGSSDGGAEFSAIHRGIHVDFHAIWVDPTDSDHLVTGSDGGLAVTWDRGRNWEVLHGFSAAQYYKITTDNSVPYNVYGGLQDNGTWGGPSRTRYREGITEADWYYIWSGDGFGAVADPLEPNIVFATSQGGNLGCVDVNTAARATVQKPRPPDGQARFNWDTPFFLSPHNRLTLYFAGNYAYRAHRYAHLDQRATRSDYGPTRNARSMQAEIISPQLSLGERGTATAFAESPLRPGLLYLGTDDGALWRTPDGGTTWEPLQDNVMGLPGPRYVSSVTPSHHSPGRVYLTFEGHRSDDMTTYVFVSSDRGDTWKSLADDLPLEEPVHCIVEDPRNEDLLFIGTEFTCYVSLDRGGHWLPFETALPTVSMRDLAIQDRDSDLVVGTHGRGAWAVDIEPLRQMTADAAGAAAHLFTPENAILWQLESRSSQGHKQYRAPNPPAGATIYASFGQVPAEPPAVTIHDVTGEQIAELKGKARFGLQAFRWNGRAGNRTADPGTYSARLKTGDDEQIVVFELHPDPVVDAAQRSYLNTPSRN